MGARGLLALLGFQLRELLEDERVRVIGELGDEREVVPTEAVRVVVFAWRRPRKSARRSR